MTKYLKSSDKRMDWYGNVRPDICFYFYVYLYTSSPLENKIIFIVSGYS